MLRRRDHQPLLRDDWCPSAARASVLAGRQQAESRTRRGVGPPFQRPGEPGPRPRPPTRYGPPRLGIDDSAGDLARSSAAAAKPPGRRNREQARVMRARAISRCGPGSQQRRSAQRNARPIPTCGNVSAMPRRLPLTASVRRVVLPPLSPQKKFGKRFGGIPLWISVSWNVEVDGSGPLGRHHLAIMSVYSLSVMASACSAILAEGQSRKYAEKLAGSTPGHR